MTLSVGGAGLGVALLQVTVVALLGVLAWSVVRRGGPAWCGAVLVAALAGVFIVPALSAVAPIWLPLPEFALLADTSTQPDVARIVVPPLPSPPIADAGGLAVFLADPSGKLPLGLIDPMGPFDDLFRTPEEAELINALSAAPRSAPPPRPAEAPARAVSWVGAVAGAWLIGVVACLTRALARLVLLYRWAWQARPVREPVGFHSPKVALRQSRAVTSPLTLGLFRPVILLPVGWRSWSAQQSALILAHELAHVRRRDFLAGLVAELAVCVCWFHPLVYWLASRLRLEQEYAADAWAASAAKNAKDYVRCLARLALELGQGRGSLAPAFWRRRPEILRRIDMLRRHPQGQSPRLGTRAAWTVVVMTAAVCLAVAGVGHSRSTATEPPPVGAAPEVNAPTTTDVFGDPLPAGALARLGTTRWRHGGNVTFVAFGPEGKTLITAGQDSTVRVWDLATGQEIRRFGNERRAEGQPAVPVPPAVPARAKLVAPAKAPAQPKEIKPPTSQQATIPAEKAQVDVKQALIEAEIALKKAQAAAAAQAIVLPPAVAATGSSVAVARDGKTLAIANANIYPIHLYDVASGKETRTIEGVRSVFGLTSLLFSPDGRALAARTTDGAVVLWDTTTGQEVQRISAPTPPSNVRSVPPTNVRGGGPGMAFGPDGKTLAVATTEFKQQANSLTIATSVKLWDVATGKETGQIQGPDGQILSDVAFAPNGKVLAYGALNVVRVCGADTGKDLIPITLTDRIASLAFAPDGKSLAVALQSQQVFVWDAETGKERYRLGEPTLSRNGPTAALATVATPEIRAVAYSPDGKQIVTASGSTVRLWDSTTGKEMPLAEGHQAALIAVALSTDGKTAVSWGADYSIRRWDATSGKQLNSFRPPPDAAAVALAPDGRLVALAKAGNRIQFVDPATGIQVGTLTGPSTGISGLAFTPDGKMLAARGADYGITIFDLAHDRELRTIAPATSYSSAPGVVIVNALGRVAGGSPVGLTFSPDGKLLATVGAPYAIPGTRTTRSSTDIYDVTTGKLIRKLESAQPAGSLAFSPDGRILAAENTDQSITLWDVASGKERTHLERAAANPQAAPAVPAVFAVKTDQRIAPIAPAGPVSLAFSPDGTALVARGPDSTVRVWDVATGKDCTHLKGHDGRIETVVFAPTGRIVASGSADTTVLLWDAAVVLKDVPKPTLAEVPGDSLDRLWTDLSGEDAGKAFQSLLTLAGDPKQAVSFLSERLKPAAAVDLKQVERWIADLESDRFAVRQEAATNLVKAGEQVVPSLQKVLASQPTIETRKRVEELVEKLTGGTLTGEQLRFVRSVETLERIGTPEARQLLQTLSQGAPGALTTRQAQEALDRLQKRS
jgi:WD40 repeat protein/beta-lactamase regulating signal transducer with metallopeptidase domain